MSTEPLISINVSSNKTLTFYEDYLIYKGIKIAYADIEGISYLWQRTTTSVYFVPAGSTSKYSIKLKVGDVIHDINFSSGTFFIGKGKSEKNTDELFKQFYVVLENLIKPYVVINILVKFAEEGELKIDKLTIKPDGIYRKRTFGKPEYLPWDNYYNSTLESGILSVLKDDTKKKYKVFFNCSMGIMNAVVLPEVLQYLFSVNGVLDKETIKNLQDSRKGLANSAEQHAVQNTGAFCWSCGGVVEPEQKFCTHCGSKLA